MHNSPVARNREEVRAEFDAHGASLTDWAKAHRFPRRLVSDVLNGRLQGKRGAAHRAAIALGIKADPKLNKTGKGR